MGTTPDPRVRSEPAEGKSSRQVRRGTEYLDVFLEDLPLSEGETRIAINRLARQMEEAVTCYLEESAAHLAQKQADAAEAAKRAHDFQVLRHNSSQRMSWTILVFMLLVMASCLAFSVWMIASGREQSGLVLALATTSGLAYLAGFGTPRGKLWRGGPDSQSGG
jgi:hypothetical protein